MHKTDVFCTSLLNLPCTWECARYKVKGIDTSLMLRKRALVESVNDELKNIAQIEHSRHRSFANFITNALSAIAAYCFFPKKPSISLVFVADNQLTLF